MKNLALACLAFVVLALSAPHARAQASGTGAAGCGSLTVPAGFGNTYPSVDAKGRLCDGGSGSVVVIQPDPAISTGYQQLTSLATAASFTPPALTTFCIIQAEAQPIRFRADGTAPTASVGQLLNPGQPASFRMSIANLTALQFIQTASAGILNVSCFKDS